MQPFRLTVHMLHANVTRVSTRTKECYTILKKRFVNVSDVWMTHVSPAVTQLWMSNYTWSLVKLSRAPVQSGRDKLYVQCANWFCIPQTWSIFAHKYASKYFSHFKMRNCWKMIAQLKIILIWRPTYECEFYCSSNEEPEQKIIAHWTEQLRTNNTKCNSEKSHWRQKSIHSYNHVFDYRLHVTAKFSFAFCVMQVIAQTTHKANGYRLEHGHSKTNQKFFWYP